MVLAQNNLKIKELKLVVVIEKALSEKKPGQIFFISDFMHFGDKEIRGHTEKIMNCFM